MTWRRALLGLALLAGLGLAVAWWRRAAPPVPPWVDTDGADTQAIELIDSTRREVVARPRSAAAWGKLGMVLRAHGYAEESSFCFEQAERLDPAEPRWPYYRGLTLVLTEPAEGLACLRRAVARWKGGPLGPRFRLAEVLLEQGELDEAGELLEQAREEAPDHPRGHLLRARLAFARQRWKTVLAEVRGCRDDRHSRRAARLLAAEAWQRLEEPGRAEQALAEARQLPPDVPWSDPLVAEVEDLVVGRKARLALASNLERQGQVDQAVGVLEQVVEEHPRDGPAWVQLGQALRRLGRFAPAEQALERALEVGPGNVEAWFELGVVRVFLSKRDQAIEAFREAARLKPDHTLAHYNLGLCLKDAGDRATARRAFQQALRCQPDHAPSRKALAELDRAAATKP